MLCAAATTVKGMRTAAPSQSVDIGDVRRDHGAATQLPVLTRPATVIAWQQPPWILRLNIHPQYL